MATVKIWYKKHHNRAADRSQVHTGSRTTYRPRSHIHKRAGMDPTSKAIGPRTGGTEAQVLIFNRPLGK